MITFWVSFWFSNVGAVGKSYKPTYTQYWMGEDQLDYHTVAADDTRAPFY